MEKCKLVDANIMTGRSVFIKYRFFWIFLYRALTHLIEKRFLLHGMREENLETFLQDAVDALFNPRMFFQIRKCLQQKIDAKTLEDGNSSL
jgi:hypothetical protein